MSQEQIKAFLAKVKGDTSLQEKLKSASDADAVVAIAKEAGYVFTSEDFNNSKEEISADELEAVAGGKGWSIINSKEYNAAGICEGQTITYH